MEKHLAGTCGSGGSCSAHPAGSARIRGEGSGDLSHVLMKTDKSFTRPFSSLRRNSAVTVVFVGVRSFAGVTVSTGTKLLVPRALTAPQPLGLLFPFPQGSSSEEVLLLRLPLGSLWERLQPGEHMALQQKPPCP